MAAAVAVMPPPGAESGEAKPETAEVAKTKETEEEEKEGEGSAGEAVSGSDKEDVDTRDDLVALVRASLQPGEYLLEKSEVCKANLVSKFYDEHKGICNKERILEMMKDMQYKTPEGAKRIPWVDYMVIDAQQVLPKKMKAKDGVKLESEFINMSLAGVKEAYRRLNVMKVPCHRPPDFYAEMYKTDKQMYAVRQRAAEESRRIRIVEERRKNIESKKFSKKAKTSKIQARAKEKAQTLDSIATWRKREKSVNNSLEEKDLNDILDKRMDPRQASEGKGGGKAGGKTPDGRMKRDKFGNLIKGQKRVSKDSKYGFGGKKRFAKSGDKSSTDDFSQSQWSKSTGKGKGKGGSKGKGKGSKGKGKSKGGGKSKAGGEEGGKSGGKKRKRGTK